MPAQGTYACPRGALPGGGLVLDFGEVEDTCLSGLHVNPEPRSAGRGEKAGLEDA